VAKLVASFCLEATDDGPSLMDLHATMLDILAGAADLQQKINEQVVSAVGRRLAEAEDTRFDIASAFASLRWFVGDQLPQVVPPFPAGVSDVRFVSDLNAIAAADNDVLDRAQLWRALRVDGSSR
jgi:hypothetical protein